MSRVLIGSIRTSTPAASACARRPGEVGEIGLPQRGAAAAGGRQAGHHVDARAARAPPRSRGRAPSRCGTRSSRPGRQAMPRSPAAKSPGGALKSTCCEAVLGEQRCQRRRGPLVREQELDRAEAVARRRRRSDRGTRAPRTSCSGWRRSAACVVSLRAHQRAPNCRRSSSICERRQAAPASASRRATGAPFPRAPRAAPWPRPAFRPRRSGRGAPA